MVVIGTNADEHIEKLKTQDTGTVNDEEIDSSTFPRFQYKVNSFFIVRGEDGNISLEL